MILQPCRARQSPPRSGLVQPLKGETDSDRPVVRESISPGIDELLRNGPGLGLQYHPAVTAIHDPIDALVAAAQLPTAGQGWKTLPERGAFRDGKPDDCGGLCLPEMLSAHRIGQIHAPRTKYRDYPFESLLIAARKT